MTMNPIKHINWVCNSCDEPHHTLRKAKDCCSNVSLKTYWTCDCGKRYYNLPAAINCCVDND